MRKISPMLQARWRVFDNGINLVPNDHDRHPCRHGHQAAASMTAVNTSLYQNTQSQRSKSIPP